MKDGRRGFGQGVLGVARFETLLRRLFSVKGVVAPAITPEIQAGIEVDGLRPEYGWLRGELLCHARVQQAAVAGQFSLVSFFPSVTSQLYVIEGLYLYASGAAAARIRIDARLAGNLVSNATGVRDARAVSGSPLGTLVPYNATNVANQISQEYVDFALAAQTLYFAPVPWVLYGGGQSLNIELDTVNITLRVGVLYTERVAELSEL